MINGLKSKLTNFINLSLDEKKMILEWRNSDSIKKWMFNRDEILLTDHLTYIDSLKNKSDRVYFLLKSENNYLGIVDLTEIKKEKNAELGIYMNPELKGYGTLLMNKIVEYSFNELNIEILKTKVYDDNIKAIKLYKKFNFKTIDDIEDENGKLYCMELKNENR